MFTRVFDISGLLYHGSVKVSYKIIPFFVDYLVKIGHIDRKIYPTFENGFVKYWLSIVKQL